MSFDHDLFHFLFGFLGIISLGLFFLVVVGFYQVEIAGTSNLSAAEVKVSPLEYRPLGQSPAVLDL